MAGTVSAVTDILNWGHWAVANHDLFNYEEIRPIQLFLPTLARKITNDCSGTIDWYWWISGCPDPMGFNYDNPAPGEDEGNTDTLAARGQEVTLEELQLADIVIYWPPGDISCSGDSAHTALIVGLGSNPLTVSHGQQSEPGYVTVAEDGRPHKFYRFNTTKPAPPTPPTPTPPPAPKVDNDMGILVTSSGKTGGIFWIRGAKICNVSGAQQTALLDAGVEKKLKAVTDADIKQFVDTAWADM